MQPNEPAYKQSPESAYCGAASATSYSGSTTTVSGTASFQYRKIQTVGLCVGLCGTPQTLGTTYAEVRIVDSAGTTIQCGETDATGNFSMTIPQTAGSYKVQVYSRSYTDKVRASVLADIYTAAPYVVESAFAVTAGQNTVSGLTVLASARSNDSDGKIPGAAFNILANIFWANEFIRKNTVNTFVADKVTVMWKAGFNPYSYFNAPSVLASFYIASEDRLYILGGKNNNVNTSDTDHFDDSVILHEYGHFLEAHYAQSSSPGGSHNGNFIIDPRLAWSEGWANFFQAAVQNDVMYNSSYTGPRKGTGGFSSYLDTVGFAGDTGETGGSTSIQISRDLTEDGASATKDRVATNEGVFREFSISRTLYKSLTNGGGLPFAALWDAFKALRADSNITYRFANFGLYNSLLANVLSTTYPMQNLTTWNSVLSNEQQKKDITLYSNTLNTAAPSGGTCTATVALSPVVDVDYGYYRSNLLVSNRFYSFYHDGNSKKIGLRYANSGNDIIDLNLYLYKEGYYYSEEEEELESGFSNSTLVRRSKGVNNSSNAETELVDLAGLPAGNYMINVKAATYGKISAALDGTANFYLYFGTNSVVTTCLVPN